MHNLKQSRSHIYLTALLFIILNAYPQMSIAASNNEIPHCTVYIYNEGDINGIVATSPRVVIPIEQVVPKMMTQLPLPVSVTHHYYCSNPNKKAWVYYVQIKRSSTKLSQFLSSLEPVIDRSAIFNIRFQEVGGGKYIGHVKKDMFTGQTSGNFPGSYYLPRRGSSKFVTFNFKIEAESRYIVSETDAGNTPPSPFIEATPYSVYAMNTQDQRIINLTQLQELVVPLKLYDNPCSTSISLNVSPSIIDFGIIDTLRNNSVHRPFSFSMTRSSSNGCTSILDPTLTLEPTAPLLNNQALDLQNGYSVSIQDKNGQNISYGQPTDLDQVHGNSARYDYTAILNRNPKQDIKLGSFATTLKYVIRWR